MFKKIFITGLTVIIPLIITIYVIGILFHFADSILGQYINTYLQEAIGFTIPGLGIILAILIIFLLGLIVHLSEMRFFRWFFRWIGNLFFRIPLVGKIYFPIQKIVNFLFLSGKKEFKSACLVEYPRKGVYSIGFITNESEPEFCKKTGKKLCNVFMSSSPWPLTGFTIVVEESELIFLDMGVDEALQIIISGGLLKTK
jgi:uncharacterized membrane protein